MGTFRVGAVLLAAIVTVSACAAAPQIKDVEQIAPDTKVVFGSAEVWSDNEQQKWGPTWTGHNHFYLFILPEGSSEAITYHLDKDGQFYWALPSGNYLLLGYEWQKNQQRMSSDIGATFSVPEEGVDQYIGALEFRGNDYILQTFLLDHYDKARELYDARFPGRKSTSEKQLMELLPPLGEFEAVAGQCHESWSIECDNRYSGVTPLSPEVTTLAGFKPARRQLRLGYFRGGDFQHRWHHVGLHKGQACHVCGRHQGNQLAAGYAVQARNQVFLDCASARWQHGVALELTRSFRVHYRGDVVGFRTVVPVRNAIASDASARSFSSASNSNAASQL
jgi:hypothetical protein